MDWAFTQSPKLIAALIQPTLSAFLRETSPSAIGPAPLQVEAFTPILVPNAIAANISQDKAEIAFGRCNMSDDPLGSQHEFAIAPPPLSGPGSSKKAWVQFARELSHANASCLAVIDEQSATIRELKWELEALREQIGRYKRRGGRRPIPDATVRQIEAELAEGRYTQSAIAVRNRVSAMSVSRIAQRIAERQRLLKG